MDNENANNPDEKKSLKDDFDESATPDDLDDSKVKFLNGGKEALEGPHVVVEVGSEVSFTGLGKEELMQYANDPFWVRLRIILFALFWIGWVAMLVAAVVIIVMAPRCPERPDMKWYQQEAIYQIFPKSFQDSTQDSTDEGAGIGDLQGIKNRIDYLQDRFIKSIWVNSFYQTENVLDGDDIVDHKAINPIMGDRATYDALKKTMKKKGMKLIHDFIPNHTGKKHPWFVKSQDGEEAYRDYYIWADGKGVNKDDPPNNWVDEFGDSAWEYDDKRKQFYYHSSLKQYPDLNLRNEDVLAELDGILRHWLDAGADGFNVKGIQRLVEHNDTAMDETMAGDSTVDQPENLDLIRRWRKILNSYSDKPGRERVMIASVVEKDNNTKKYYEAGVHIVPSAPLAGIDTNACDVDCLVEKLTMETEVGKWRGWQLGNDESARFGSIISEKYQKAFQVLSLFLPGTPVLYYGDEIAMTNGQVTGADQNKDPMFAAGKASRDPYRTPMLWTNKEKAGFCIPEAKPWLPINTDFRRNNVELNTAHLLGYTMLESFTDLMEMRKNESIQFGTLHMDTLHSDILYFTRKAPGFPGYLVAINRGRRSAYSFSHIAHSLTLVYHSDGGEKGQKFDAKSKPIGFTKEGEVYIFQY